MDGHEGRAWPHPLDRLVDGLLTIAAGLVVGTACAATADALDPVGAEARAALTDDGLAAFLQACA